ncbi:4-hydroxyphenylacetate 3-hydroxylase N-terminal domain-containing protein [Microbispora amethystogenes]|uniref:4-hydroxyphenylacetate 3-monooxygenase n=1 Tax=Microbispora cellulosiformans TaxID=2614688 RepID=A0A5J5K9J2_9ACTN|nr:4-hydroxyphenylacetate 3-hydroxylase N-terminal domain-containing protein [Microbispora cellulosiformans]KAA9381325.1 4-hydroxyphenylacetate 3-monooxygenase [Microbispora cellulosiformans]
MTRTGKDYLDALRDGRTIWLDGERVDDLTTHPAFRRSVRSIADLYDLTAEHPETLTASVPGVDGPVSRAYQIPRTKDELKAKGRAFKLWSEATFGFLGRSPDYMASAVAGMATVPGVLARDGFDGSANLLAHWRRMAEGDLYQAHTLVNPQIDRTKAPSEQMEDDLCLRVVAERDDGIVVRGAKMIGTAAALADEILVGVTQRMPPSEADYAVSFSVPVAAPGISFVSRTSYEARATSVFDYPLASRLDENDALVVYDDVFVPWERVFAYRDPEACHAQFWKTPAFVSFVHHGATRFWTKLEFLTGIAILVAKANNVYDMPPVRMQIGKLLSWVNTAKALVVAAEELCEPVPGADAVMPHRETAYAQLAVGPDLYPKVINEIKLLAGGGLIQLPSSYRDLLRPEVAALLGKYVKSPGYDAESRIKLFKLAWDAVGSEFAGRHDQYERFYHGAPHVYLPALVREGDPGRYAALAGRCLDGYELEDG